jgi:hypothetical protein
VALTPLARTFDATTRCAMRYVTVEIDRAGAHWPPSRVKAPEARQPADVAGIEAAGQPFWYPLQLARQLDDAILHRCAPTNS